MADTITFDESAKGWTSFHSFIPDWMTRLGSRFFTTKGGQLYIHNDETSDLRNNFYGVQYPTTLTYVINNDPSIIKVAKTINTESNKPFSATIRSYINDEETSITESSIDVTEFVNKEGKWYGYTRRNELSGDFTAKNAYGIGRVQGVVGNIITTQTEIPLSLISVGDSLLDVNAVPIGIIDGHTLNTITLDIAPTLVSGDFLLGLKNTRVEGSEIRGYNFEVKLTDNTATRTEIFAASSEMFKSEPS
jgi:hypothetical protein